MKCGRTACPTELDKEKRVFSIDNDVPRPPRRYCDSCGKKIISFNQMELASGATTYELKFQVFEKLTDKEIERLENRMNEISTKVWDLQAAAVDADETVLRDQKRWGEIGADLIKEQARLSRHLRLNRDPKMSKIDSDLGDRMSLEEFLKCVACGGFIDYDGYGHYVRGDQESDIAIYPSDVVNNAVRPDFTEIIWYNR
jgi:RNA polymerase-binding transcription factor DksA